MTTLLGDGMMTDRSGKDWLLYAARVLDEGIDLLSPANVIGYTPSANDAYEYWFNIFSGWYEDKAFTKKEEVVLSLIFASTTYDDLIIKVHK
jgi:alanine-alpha-ketoisovalerate/valine-pyruvate aminotransferase